MGKPGRWLPLLWGPSPAPDLWLWLVQAGVHGTGRCIWVSTVSPLWAVHPAGLETPQTPALGALKQAGERHQDLDPTRLAPKFFPSTSLQKVPAVRPYPFSCALGFLSSFMVAPLSGAGPSSPWSHLGPVPQPDPTALPSFRWSHSGAEGEQATDERGLSDKWKPSQPSSEQKTQQCRDGSEREGSGKHLLVLHGPEGFIRDAQATR